jgi:hypothetical protein
MRRAPTISIALAAFALAGCVSTYGNNAVDFSPLVVKSKASSKEYRLVRYSDYVSAFPDKPGRLDKSDPRLARFFKGRPISHSNQPSFGYAVGRYFITYTCGDQQIFKGFSLPVTTKTTSVVMTCG